MRSPQIKNIALITTNQVDLGVRALSGALREVGCDVRLFFLEYPQRQYPADLVDQFAALVRDADLIGISTLAYSHRRTQQLARGIRPLGVPLILGGLHCTFRSDEAIQDADIICLGEGEQTIVDLVCGWPDRFEIPGLWLRESNGSIRRNPQRPLQQALDDLPMPDFSPERVYFLEGATIVKDTGRIKETHHHQIGDRTTFVYASDRGCPLACTFCYNHQVRQLHPGQRPLRFKGVDRIMAELRQVVANYPDTRFINFMNDDSFARTDADILEFARRYRDEIGLPFFMMGTPNTITKKRLTALVEAGLAVLNMGIQSGSDSVNKQVYGRPCPRRRVLETSHVIQCFADQIAIYYDLIINSPFEDEEDLLATVSLVRELPRPFYLVTHNLVVGEGTRLWNVGRSQGMWDHDEADRIYRSDFHDYENFERRRHVDQYLNHVLEWMAGRHDEKHLGRLPRRVGDLDPSGPLAAMLAGCPAFLKARPADPTLDMLISSDILAAMRSQAAALEGVTRSLGPKRYWETPAYHVRIAAATTRE